MILRMRARNIPIRFLGLMANTNWSSIHQMARVRQRFWWRTCWKILISLHLILMELNVRISRPKFQNWPMTRATDWSLIQRWPMEQNVCYQPNWRMNLARWFQKPKWTNVSAKSPKPSTKTRFTFLSLIVTACQYRWSIQSSMVSDQELQAANTEFCFKTEVRALTW